MDAKTYRVQDLVAKKADGQEFAESEIEQLVTAIADGSMADVQLGALLMAIFIKGLSSRETTDLTLAMKNSGSVMEWPPEWVVGDKHSTGGVGDKVSLPLTPALAACGLKTPMISGRGLGHTGGTLDKLDSIPGFNTCLPSEQLLSALRTVGCAITGQTADIAPADKRMYAARDITNTVASLPLIVSSILSKKAAESLNSLVLDVKFGSGSFMGALEKSESLAKALVSTMKNIGVKTTALLTNMDNPIGRAVGNALEVQESVQCLNGKGPEDLRSLVVAFGGELLASSGLCTSAYDGQLKISAALDDGSARQTFCQMLQAQDVREEVAIALCNEEDGILPRAQYTTPLLASQSGVVVRQDALMLGECSVALGAGRTFAGQPILYDVGIFLDKVVGEQVQQGEAWATVHHREVELPCEILMKLQAALTVDPARRPFQQPPRVSKIIT